MASINRSNQMTLLKSRSTFICLAMLKCLQHAVHVPHVTVVGYYVSYLKVWTIATFDISLRPNCHTPSFFFFFFFGSNGHPKTTAYRQQWVRSIVPGTFQRGYVSRTSTNTYHILHNCRFLRAPIGTKCRGHCILY